MLDCLLNFHYLQVLAGDSLVPVCLDGSVKGQLR